MQLEQNIYYKIKKSSITKITIFYIKTRIYTNEFLKFLLIFAAFWQKLHPQICRLPRQAANVTCILQMSIVYISGSTISIFKLF